jgi:capsular polysaccharide transport system permease protein
MLRFLKKINVLLTVVVIIPTILSVIYYGLIASDLFHSESKFVVRSAQRQQAPSLLGSILSGSIFTRTQDEAYVVHDFILSRDALVELNKTLNLGKAYASEKNDFLTRFPAPWSDDSFESLYRHYQNHILISYDNTSGISTLRTASHDASLAQLTNERLLAMSEQLVNEISERGRNDLIRYATAEVTDAEKRVKEASSALAGYRSQRIVFDPERQAALQLQQLSKLQDELIASKSQLAQLKALSPENPQIPVLQKRTEMLQTEVNNETARVLGRGDTSLAGKAADFERLNLEKAFAERQLASAMTAMENARNESRRKSMYLEKIVAPITADRAAEPRRLRAIALTLTFSIMLYAVLSLLVAGIKEHQEH